MKCFKCNITLEEFGPKHPNNGIHVFTHGHYGSKVIDSIDNKEYIEFYICDKCLNKGISSKHIKRIITGA